MVRCFSRSGILDEATSTLIKTFSIVIFLNLYYTFRTYDGQKSNEQQVKSNEQRAKSTEQQARSSASQVRYSTTNYQNIKY